MKSCTASFSSATPRNRRGEQGFILPLSVLLVLLITISGTSFMQLDFLERRMATDEVDNHAAFYLANTGIERARDALKISLNPLTWTSVLDGSQAGYAVDATPDSLLCPDAATYGCTILPFGATVASPDNLAFNAGFSRGAYAVRAFNNASDAGHLQDTDQILTVRALGTIPTTGQVKLLEASVFAASGLNMINCASGSNCPNRVNGNPTMDPAPGREPAVGPVPAPTLPLTDPANYYRTAGNFPTLTVRTFTGTVQDNSYYFVSGDRTIQNVSGNNVVLFVTGALSVKTGTVLSNAILIGVNSVQFQGSASISAPSPYPAVMSGGDITKSSGSAAIYGTVYAGGTIDFNPVDVHGVVIGNQVKIQGSSTYSDDHNTDPNYLKHYGLMPGFTYPPDILTAITQAGSWKEIQ